MSSTGRCIPVPVGFVAYYSVCHVTQDYLERNFQNHGCLELNSDSDVATVLSSASCHKVLPWKRRTLLLIDQVDATAKLLSNLEPLFRSDKRSDSLSILYVHSDAHKQVFKLHRSKHIQFSGELPSLQSNRTTVVATSAWEARLEQNFSTAHSMSLESRFELADKASSLDSCAHLLPAEIANYLADTGSVHLRGTSSESGFQRQVQAQRVNTNARLVAAHHLHLTPFSVLDTLSFQCSRVPGVLSNGNAEDECALSVLSRLQLTTADGSRKRKTRF